MAPNIDLGCRTKEFEEKGMYSRTEEAGCRSAPLKEFGTVESPQTKILLSIRPKSKYVMFSASALHFHFCVHFHFQVQAGLESSVS